MKKTEPQRCKSLLTKLIVYSVSLALSGMTAGCAGFGESKSTLARKRVLEQVRSSMVPVRIYFKRDIENEFYAEDELSYQERFAQQMAERKMSLDLGGLVLDEQGHILIADPEIEQRLIDRIEVVIDGEGQARPGRLVMIIKKMDAAILQLSDPSKLKPLRFTESDEFDKGTVPPLYLVSISRAGAGWYIGSGSAAGSYRLDSEDPVPQYLLGQVSGDISDQLAGAETTGSTPYLVVDEKGNCLGAVMRGIVDLSQQYRIWKGQDILAAMRSDLEVSEFLRSQEELKDRFGRLYHQVKIYYRQPSEEDYGRTAKPEQIFYGLALNSTELLVPAEISRIQAKQIESIEVKLGAGADEQTCKAEFVGAYRDFAAFLVRIKDAELGKRLDLESTGEVNKVVPFRTVYARHRFGGKDLQVWYARCLRES